MERRQIILPRTISWILSAAAVLLPLVVIALYSTLRETGYDAVIYSIIGKTRYGAAIYGMSVAIAAGFWGTKWSKRLLFSALVAVVGLLLREAFDAIMILGIALAAGAIAVGHMPFSVEKKWWKNILYRLARMFIAGGLVILSLRFPLPSSGRCPGGGGDITEVFSTFAIMTYLPIAGMIALDGLAKLSSHRNE